MEKQVNLELMEYVETAILPRYAAFDRAHRLLHANSVISRSLEIARQVGADINMAYTIAAYHDLGLEGPRAKHHITGGKILAADKKLLKWFSEAQIKIMKEAVEDHRASLSRAPRSIYGKIVAEADRDLTPDTVLRRTVEFGIDNYPEKTKEEHWQRFLKHLQEKYSSNGYIHLWIPGTRNERDIKELQKIIENRDALREKFETFYKLIKDNE